VSLYSPTQFRDLVSGRRRGLWAALVRGGLQAAELPVAWAVRRRNRRYDSASAAVQRVGVPVVSVGNLTLGGTGKTPLVAWLAQWFAGRGVPVGLLSRGYGSRRGQANDEARQLARDLPGLPHLQQPDRVAAARRAIDQLGCRLLILDDGFQHRRIGRDLDIVLLDASEPLGFGHVFPRGTLREPPEGLGRAHVVALSRADMLPADQRQALRRRVAWYCPRAVWLELVHAPQALLAAGGDQQPLDWLAAKRVLAFCGIGNPAGFRHTLSVCGCQAAEFLEFPDHHAYRRRDLDRLAAAAQRLDVAALVCTQKDLVKLDVDRLGDRPLRAIRIGVEIPVGREALETKLAALLP
jgi:tetraacyldisaccharide 4'-kinase